MDTSAAATFGQPHTTRFAPSPTGELHLGNARTALFNFLLAHYGLAHHGLAQHQAGRFLLRIEDTDTERSREQHTEALIADLRWLGMNWDAGPDHEDSKGPYRQSQRGALYAGYFTELDKRGAVYPCFCTPLELEASRRAQLAQGRPPRYAGTCRDLSAEQRQKKGLEGLLPTTRFRVPLGRRIEFLDFVHGPQSFLSDDIGDFVVRRADGTAAFFFCNAVDDADMGVTHVLRGEDHLTNTPRQLMILDALGLRAPSYGHVSLIVGNDGSPLSKRHGATSVREYRERGYLPQAMTNHLFRLGHSTSEHGFLSLDEMARAFDAAHLGRAPARFDEQQLLVWQKEAVHRLSTDEALRWLGPVLPARLDEKTRAAFIAAVLPNLVLPEDARAWVNVVFGDLPDLEPAEQQLVLEAGKGYFSAAADAAAANGNDLAAIANAVRSATGKKGAALYMPLRVALTGRAHGPELAPLLKAMPPGKARERLARFA
jgi:nondiscriminating glutamyl-tRNA synthetase